MRTLALLICLTAACDVSRLDVETSDRSWREEVDARSARRRDLMRSMRFNEHAAQVIDACFTAEDRKAAIACIRGRGPGGEDLYRRDPAGHVVGVRITPAECLDLWAEAKEEPPCPL